MANKSIRYDDFNRLFEESKADITNVMSRIHTQIDEYLLHPLVNIVVGYLYGDVLRVGLNKFVIAELLAKYHKNNNYVHLQNQTVDDVYYITTKNDHKMSLTMSTVEYSIIFNADSEILQSLCVCFGAYIYYSIPDDIYRSKMFDVICNIPGMLELKKSLDMYLSKFYL